MDPITPTMIAVDLIQPNPYQPRQVEDLDVVAELADSIARNGLMQVPTARQVNGHYELAFGHTRLAAYKMLQEPCMPLIIRDLDDLQMFEMAVAENIKRRDLNPIEQAEAMRRYMDEFGKNSREAGEFFGVSEEQVRATVRLLNLHPAAQEAVRAGKINVTAARSILSVQKIAPEGEVAKIVDQVVAGKDEYGNPAVPEEIIESAIRDMENEVLVHMWADEWNGKPRSSHAGWLLSMKNFPMKHLPELTAVDAVVALGVQENEEACEAVEAYLDTLSAQDASALDIAELLEDRRQAQEKLDEIDPGLRERLNHLLNPPACNSCPFYTRLNGSHYCGVKICHDRKTIAWSQSVLEMASKSLGIKIYDKKTDGKYAPLYGSGDNKLFAARHPELRLMLRSEIRAYYWQNFPGVDSDLLAVVATGSLLKGDKQADTEAEERAQERSEAKAEMERQYQHRRMRELVYWEAANTLKEMFAGLNAAAIKAFLPLCDVNPEPPNDEIQPVGEDAPADERADYLRRIFAYEMIMTAAPYDIETSWERAVEAAEWVSETVKSWGAKLPRLFFKFAERLDEEISEKIAAVTAVTPGKKGKKGKQS